MKTRAAAAAKSIRKLAAAIIGAWRKYQRRQWRNENNEAWRIGENGENQQ